MSKTWFVISLAVALFWGAEQRTFAIPVADSISDSALQQIAAFEQEKATRSKLHRKLDSALVYKLKLDRHQFTVPGLTNWQPHLQFERDGRVLVDMEADVTDDLVAEIRRAGGTVLHSAPRFHAIRASLPLASIESLAALTNVNFIKRAVPARVFTGSVNSQGDVTHGANLARTNFAVDGTGIKVGVISDSVDYLADAQATGDLPTNVMVLSGQDGVPATGEGTAMLEIVNDLAPGAQLYFATAFGSEAGFAQNILDLRSNGCDIIVDDVAYFDESPFQDGIVAQAINRVTADGALYFSATGNGGNKDNKTSGTWEGNFSDGGAVSTDKGDGRLHNFGRNTFNRTTVYGAETNAVVLFWSDPLGFSTNDYDLFVLNPSGTQVFDASVGTQDGMEDPFEICGATNNCQILIVKSFGVARFLHLQLETDGYGSLSKSTAGGISGHPMATNAFAVAAVDANTAYPNLFTTNNSVEYFSADGPRRVFFNADGSAITPGNFSSTGGALRLKPDLAAANGVSTSVPGFAPFYGTSAAAPHAAAIAALLLSYDPALTPAQIRTALTGTALDIGAPGFDRDSGAGIVMPSAALQWAAAQFLVPNITSIIATNGVVPIAWNAQSNHVYQVQFTTNLAQINWVNLGSPIAATNANAVVNDTSGDSSRFYRVQLVH